MERELIKLMNTIDADRISKRRCGEVIALKRRQLISISLQQTIQSFSLTIFATAIVKQMHSFFFEVVTAKIEVANPLTITRFTILCTGKTNFTRYLQTMLYSK